MNQRITLLIPTMNRSEFLIRLLSYYRDVGFQGRICIGDSSGAHHVERTKSAIRSLQGKLRIEYHERLGLSYSACSKKLSELVSTPYAVYCSDDNFLIPGGLDQCIEFLDNHSDYVAAHGVGAMFSLDSSGPYGNFRNVHYYPQRAIEAKTASQRLFDYVICPFVPLSSVHRTDAWRGMWRDVTSLSERPFADEALPSFLSIVKGKIKELDCFYLAFQDHDQRTRHPDIFDRITNPSWAASYQIFRDCIARELMRQDSISLEEAREVVKQGFWSLLARGLTKKWEARYAPRCTRSRFRFRQAVRRVPGVKSAWRAIRSLIPYQKKGNLSLAALLEPSSPYYADFMAIYRAVSHPSPASREPQDSHSRLAAQAGCPSCIEG